MAVSRRSRAPLQSPEAVYRLSIDQKMEVAASAATESVGSSAQPLSCCSSRKNRRELCSRKNGWGGRIRTCVWRDQNPLPYHLATPQSSSRSSRPLQQRMHRRAVQPARDETAPPIRHPRRHALSILQRARSWQRYSYPCQSCAPAPPRQANRAARQANPAHLPLQDSATAPPARRHCRRGPPTRRVL